MFCCPNYFPYYLSTSTTFIYLAKVENETGYDLKKEKKRKQVYYHRSF